VDGGGGIVGVSVVNDQTGPVVVPAPLRATMLQKYVVSLASAAGA